MQSLIDNIISFIAHGILWVLALAFLCLAIGFVINNLYRLYDRAIRAERLDAAKETGAHIRSSAYWFDRRTCIVLEETGLAIELHGTHDPDRVRNRLRERLQDELGEEDA